jgi:hypothetical protein
MDETHVQRTPTETQTTIHRTTPQPSGGSGAIWFILGALVVGVVIIGYVMVGDGTIPSEAAAPAGGNTSISVETNDAPAPAADAPAADTQTEAPAETAPAQTAPTETAPATQND